MLLVRPTPATDLCSRLKLTCSEVSSVSHSLKKLPLGSPARKCPSWEMIDLRIPRGLQLSPLESVYYPALQPHTHRHLLPNYSKSLKTYFNETFRHIVESGAVGHRNSDNNHAADMCPWFYVQDFTPGNPRHHNKNRFISCVAANVISFSALVGQR